MTSLQRQQQGGAGEDVPPPPLYRTHYLLQDNQSRYCCFATSTSSKRELSLYNSRANEYFASRLTRISSLDQQLKGDRSPGIKSQQSSRQSTTNSASTKSRKAVEKKKGVFGNNVKTNRLVIGRRKSESDVTPLKCDVERKRRLEITYRAFRRASDPATPAWAKRRSGKVGNTKDT